MRALMYGGGHCGGGSELLPEELDELLPEELLDDGGRVPLDDDGGGGGGEVLPLDDDPLDGLLDAELGALLGCGGQPEPEPLGGCVPD